MHPNVITGHTILYTFSIIHVYILTSEYISLDWKQQVCLFILSSNFCFLTTVPTHVHALAVIDSISTFTSYILYYNFWKVLSANVYIFYIVRPTTLVVFNTGFFHNSLLSFYYINAIYISYYSFCISCYDLLFTMVKNLTNIFFVIYSSTMLNNVVLHCHPLLTFM